MKKSRIEYSENSITHWPYYEATKFLIIFLLLGVLAYINMIISTLLGNSASETKLVIVIFLIIMITATCVSISSIYKNSYMKIVFSNVGIELFKNKNEIEKQIKWEDVSSVYFHQDIWHGSQTIRIFLKKTVSQKLKKKNKCDFMYDVRGLDKGKLLQLIPKDLWQNHPWYS